MKKPSNMALRFLIGIPGGGIAVCLLAFGNLTLLLATIIVAWLTLQEFWRLTGVRDQKTKFPLMRLGDAAAILLIIAAWAFPSGSLDVLLLLMLLFFFIGQLFARAQGDKGFIREVAIVLIGVIYIGGLFSFIFKLRYLQIDLVSIGVLDFSNGFFKASDMIHFTIFPIIASWGSDTAALFTGKYFGQSKLAPTISPGKTVTGLTGAMIGSATVVTIYAWLIGLIGPVQIYELIAFGALAGAFSQLGDLTESAIKREANLKDSGKYFGPHGGMLDKLDGFLFTLPITYVFFMLVVG